MDKMIEEFKRDIESQIIANDCSNVLNVENFDARISKLEEKFSRIEAIDFFRKQKDLIEEYIIFRINNPIETQNIKEIQKDFEEYKRDVNNQSDRYAKAFLEYQYKTVE